MKRLLVLLLAIGALLLAGGASAAVGQTGVRQTNDYGYIALEREADCLLEELWTGMNYESVAGLAPGESWSEPSAYAWAWYRATNTCTSETITAFGVTPLAPETFSIQSMKSVAFETEIELFTEAPTEGGPPFLSCFFAACVLGEDAFGTIVVDFAMTSEGHPQTYNFHGTLPPPPGSGLGPLERVLTFQYVGGPVTGSVTGALEFSYESLLFAEMGHFVTIIIP